MKYNIDAAALGRPGLLAKLEQRSAGRIVEMDAPEMDALLKSHPKEMRGLGDIVERIAKPIAKVLHMPCLDGEQLKPESPCAKRRDKLNRLVPFSSSPTLP